MDDDDDIMNLDLNLEPASSGVGLGPLLSQLETAHGRIEDRIRQLEEVTSRARQRQRWRQPQNPPIERIAFEPRGFVGIENEGHNGEDGVVVLERASERGKTGKRDNTHLIARALEMESEVKKENDDGGSFYDCNICLEMARDPILTCCGHLFCWACFYQLQYVDLTAKECPVCKGEVVDGNITPIYGNGNNSCVLETESGLKIPPRPSAHRVESVRQQRVNRRISHIPVSEALRRIRIGIGATTEQPRQNNQSSETNLQVFPSVEATGSRRLRPRLFSRVLSESATSLSSISSALSNAERLVEDLETYLHDRLLQRTDSHIEAVTSEDPLIQRELQPVDSATEMNVSRTLLPLYGPESVPVDAGNLAVTRASSSRRRSGASRVSDVESGVSREPRRRRLR